MIRLYCVSIAIIIVVLLSQVNTVDPHNSLSSSDDPVQVSIARDSQPYYYYHHDQQQNQQRHSHNHYNDEKISYNQYNDQNNRRLGKQSSFIGCGVVPPSKEEIKADMKRMELWRRNRYSTTTTTTTIGSSSNSSGPYGSISSQITYTIPVYVHVMRPSIFTGFVSLWTIQSYIRKLNVAFRNSPFLFELKNTTKTYNYIWSNNCHAAKERIEFKTLLKVGKGDTLNVYICMGAGDVSGYSFLPGPGINNFVDDGVVVVRSEIADVVLIHEVGHFLGLQHTFNGNSCDESNEGDWVDDTPQHLEKPQESNCKTAYRDTCPTRPGRDPVFNFMTYTPDTTCYREFTEGQIERMIAQYELYRLPPPTVTQAPLPSLSSDSPSEVSLSPTTSLTLIGSSTAPTEQCQQFGAVCNDSTVCCSGRCGIFFKVLKRCGYNFN